VLHQNEMYNIMIINTYTGLKSSLQIGDSTEELNLLYYTVSPVFGERERAQKSVKMPLTPLKSNFYYALISRT
jgi:hypothetical protein